MAKQHHKTKKIEITGISEILTKLEQANIKAESTILSALKTGTSPMKNDMLSFIQQHHYSGLTEESFVEEFESGKKYIHARVGFSIRKGGIASIFLNVGTPRIAPTYFIDTAIETHNGYLNTVLKKELKKLLEGWYGNR